MRIEFDDGVYEFFWIHNEHGKRYTMRVPEGTSYLQRSREFEQVTGERIDFLGSALEDKLEEIRDAENWIYDHWEHLRERHAN